MSVKNVENVTRIEIIEDGKRKYVKWNCTPTFSLQDNDRTLKIFIINKPTDNKICSKCGTKLKKVFKDETQKMLFCPNKKCPDWLKWR